MSAWRREALRRLPEHRKVIEAAASPMTLWIELLGICEDACRASDESMVHRVYDFAHWCWQTPGVDVRTAVACAFYEHLPRKPALRRDLPRRLGRAAFSELRGIFGYHLSPEEAAKFEAEFIEAEQKFVREIL
jgi:hypothetical protein